MFIFRKKKSVIIKIFRSKKLPKILEIREIREKTTSFTIFRFFFFQIYQIVKQGKLICLYFRKKNQGLFKFL